MSENYCEDWPDGLHIKRTGGGMFYLEDEDGVYLLGGLEFCPWCGDRLVRNPGGHELPLPKQPTP